MEETLRILVSLGFAMLLVLLRSDATRFGVAEAREPLLLTPRPVARRRLGWYGLALGIAAAILIAHPDSGGTLGIRPGELGLTALLGFVAIAIGMGQAVLVASLRRRPLIPTVGPDTPWAVADGLATALVDEVAFRGAVLGFLLLLGVPPVIALLAQAVLYVVATGTLAPGRDRYLLAVAVGVALLGGAITFLAGGIGAAFLGHAAARIAIELLGVARRRGVGLPALARA